MDTVYFTLHTQFTIYTLHVILYTLYMMYKHHIMHIYCNTLHTQNKTLCIQGIALNTQNNAMQNTLHIQNNSLIPLHTIQMILQSLKP